MTTADSEPEATARVLRRIVLVDDDEILRLSLRAAFTRAGWKVVGEAADGREGVEVAIGEKPHVVLMDLSMPNMHGIEATRAIRGLGGWYADVPILGLTANVLPEQIRDYLQAGMNDVLAKPVRAADLVQKIAFWLEGPEAGIMVDDSLDSLAS